MKYDPSTFTYGYELELSDARRDIVIPPYLGAWEFAERDIVNTLPPYRGVAADPLGQSPPVGGEVNIHPARTPDDLNRNIVQVISLVEEQQGFRPNVGPTAHGHVHVHVPGLTDDIEALKQLARYVQANQRDMVRVCGGFVKKDDMPPAAVRYMRDDGGRLMPAWMTANILSDATQTFDDFISMHCKGKDPLGRSGRPFRYAINMYCLKHTKTVEFRMFRATLDYSHLKNSIEVCRDFLDHALNKPDVPFTEYGCGRGYAPMLWDRGLWDGLQKTKHPDTRGKKVRSYVDVT